MSPFASHQFTTHPCVHLKSASVTPSVRYRACPGGNPLPARAALFPENGLLPVPRGPGGASTQHVRSQCTSCQLVLPPCPSYATTAPLQNLLFTEPNHTRVSTHGPPPTCTGRPRTPRAKQFCKMYKRIYQERVSERPKKECYRCLQQCMFSCDVPYTLDA